MTQNDRDKIGNAVVYIAQRVQPLSKTKLLKLLFLMEECSVKKFHTPFIGMAFEVWQAGPVLRDIFVDLSETPLLLDGYVSKNIIEGNTYINPVAFFNDDEFSDNDMAVMDEIIRKYKDMTAKQLVELTHSEDGIWYRTAKEHGLLPLFASKLLNNTTVHIDLGSDLPDKERDFYMEQLDFLNKTRNNAF